MLMLTLRHSVFTFSQIKMFTAKNFGLIENHDSSRTLILNDETFEISGFVNGVWRFHCCTASSRSWEGELPPEN